MECRKTGETATYSGVVTEFRAHSLLCHGSHPQPGMIVTDLVATPASLALKHM